jgi:LmbE family N-acetylglucosaminyl deacetylase
MVLLLPAAPAAAQTGLDVMKVNLLFVGAHPDDDSAVVASFARYALDQGYRTGVVTITGGEGGGNATGRETGRALGLIRRAEELNALRVAGVAATDFLGLEDFYFTLSAEETERRWGTAFVCDVVRLVRLRRPEVIVTLWPGPGTHGQHQMAGRAATLAFARAGDPGYCADQIGGEKLEPFDPDRLYYAFVPEQAASLAIPTDDFSLAAGQRYAELKALSLMQYRSQGFDRFARLPVESPQPERFLLVRSRVPVEEPQAHMLSGSLRPAGGSPAGVRLRAEGEYRTPFGSATPAALTLVNGTAAILEGVELALDAEGWSVEAEGPAAAARLGPGESITARFRLQPGTGLAADRNARLAAVWKGRFEGRAASGAVPFWRRPVAPVSVRFRPGFDVAGYRRFARESDSEWVIESLPTRVPLVVGRVSPVPLDVSNRTEAAVAGELAMELPPGLRLLEPLRFEVPARSEVEVVARIEVAAAALPAERRSARLPLSVREPGHGSGDAAEAFLLPAVGAPRVRTPPAIDGDLADMAGLARIEIGPGDRWWRAAPEDAADLSASARIGWDERHLYVGLSVRDQTVVCNIAPDDVRAQLRSDAVGVTVDPSGRSEDTSTTLQVAAFPCTTAGWGARAFRDADADQGLADEKAPGLRVAARRTSEGFDVEWAIPWDAMPSRPEAGAEIGLNLVLYDGDDAEARAGANISQTGLAWAAFEWGGKQALPYLWGRVRLE